MLKNPIFQQDCTFASAILLHIILCIALLLSRSISFSFDCCDYRPTHAYSESNIFKWDQMTLQACCFRIHYEQPQAYTHLLLCYIALY